MDGDIEELTRLVKKNIALSEDTSRIVHKMRRASLWGRVFQVIWWILVLAVSGAAYYYYLQPYVEKVGELYSQIQAGSNQVQGLGAQIQHFLSSFKTQ